MSGELGMSARWRMAALDPYTDAPATTQEWLRALELGADAAVRVVLEHLRDSVEEFGIDSYGQTMWAVPVTAVEALLKEVDHG